MNEQEELNEQKSSLIDDLLATSTVMEELWLYHPDNPNKKDIIAEYETLVRIKEEIEQELEKLN